MRIEVNGLSQVAVPSSLSLGEVMGSLRSSAFSRQKVLSGIILDGEPLTAEREQSFAARPSTDFDRLTAELRDVEEAVDEVLGGLEAAVVEIGEKAAEAGDRMRLGEAGAPLIGRIAEDLHFVVHAYQAAWGLMKACGFPAAASGRDADARLEEALREILAGLAAGDMVTIGDALEHQFGPAIASLKEEIQKRRSELRRGIGGTAGGGVS